MPPEEVVLCCGAVVWYCDECDGLGGAEPAARVRHLDQRFAAMLPDTIRVVPWCCGGAVVSWCCGLVVVWCLVDRSGVVVAVVVLLLLCGAGAFVFVFLVHKQNASHTLNRNDATVINEVFSGPPGVEGEYHTF